MRFLASSFASAYLLICAQFVRRRPKRKKRSCKKSRRVCKKQNNRRRRSKRKGGVKIEKKRRKKSWLLRGKTQLSAKWTPDHLKLFVQKKEEKVSLVRGFQKYFVEKMKLQDNARNLPKFPTVGVSSRTLKQLLVCDSSHGCYSRLMNHNSSRFSDLFKWVVHRLLVPMVIPSNNPHTDSYPNLVCRWCHKIQVTTLFPFYERMCTMTFPLISQFTRALHRFRYTSRWSTPPNDGPTGGATGSSPSSRRTTHPTISYLTPIPYSVHVTSDAKEVRMPQEIFTHAQICFWKNWKQKLDCGPIQSPIFDLRIWGPSTLSGGKTFDSKTPSIFVQQQPFDFFKVVWNERFTRCLQPVAVLSGSTTTLLITFSQSERLWITTFACIWKTSQLYKGGILTTFQCQSGLDTDLWLHCLWHLAYHFYCDVRNFPRCLADGCPLRLEKRIGVGKSNGSCTLQSRLGWISSIPFELW